MEPVVTEISPDLTTRTIYGKDKRDIEFDSKIRLQFTGPGAETLYFDGPEAGKKWSVLVQLHISESDV